MARSDDLTEKWGEARAVDARRGLRERVLRKGVSAEEGWSRPKRTKTRRSSCEPGFVSGSAVRRRHVPPRKQQRQAYAAGAGSGEPARPVCCARGARGSRREWRRAIFMLASVASARTSGKHHQASSDARRTSCAEICRSRFPCPVAIVSRCEATVRYTLCSIA